jgi:glycosyltransferase involved in cell wall biosynthesis
MQSSEHKLDGTTILRFAHAFETGGGVERYLDDLDQILLQRNAMTIIRLYLASDRRQLAERVELIGRGRLVKVPLPLADNETVQVSSENDDHDGSWKRMFRDWVLYNPALWRLAAEKMLLRRPIPRRRGQAVGAGVKVAEILRRQHIDLMVLHFMGGSDSDEIIAEARKNGVPFAVVNHFSNDRFLHLSIRKHATLADAVAGVNGLDLPRYVRQKFHNVSDGIDIDFFQASLAKAPAADLPPQILLPARVVRSKGHLDLVRTAQALKRQGVPFRIAFAGRTDSEDFVRQLRAEIAQAGLDDEIKFLGSLSVERLRDAYASSAVMALPTYHHEGLPRSVIEAQAMKLPVVAYATGGLPEGLIHGETGYLVDTGDLPGFAARVEQLLCRPELRQRMGEAGRALVEQRFSLEALASRHENLYGEFLGARLEKASSH